MALSKKVEVGLFLGFLLWLLGGATGLGEESKPPWQIEWETTVAAEKEQAPHPNAAKVFINWLLSRDGQIQVQKGRKERPRTGSNSLRIDIPKNDVPEENLRRDGVDYFDADDDKFSDRRPADKLFNEIFGKSAK